MIKKFLLESIIPIHLKKLMVKLSGLFEIFSAGVSLSVTHLRLQVTSANVMCIKNQVTEFWADQNGQYLSE